MSFKNFMDSHSSEILTGFGIAGMIVSVVMAIKATPRAMKKIEKRKEELGVEKLSVIETVKTAGPCYIPTIGVMALTTASIVIPVSNEMKKGELLATGLMISEQARHDLEEAAHEVIGEKKLNEIRDKVAEKKVEQLGPNPEIFLTGKGEARIVDSLTNDYFTFDIDELKRKELEAKEETVNFMFISVNEWRAKFGLKPLHAALGDLGWGPNTGFEIYYSYQAGPDGNPCCVINYLTPPKPRNEAQ